MNACRYCGKEITARFGHLARHEDRCPKRPREEEKPRYERRRVFNTGVNVFVRQ